MKHAGGKRQPSRVFAKALLGDERLDSPNSPLADLGDESMRFHQGIALETAALWIYEKSGPYGLHAAAQSIAHLKTIGQSRLAASQVFRETYDPNVLYQDTVSELARIGQWPGSLADIGQWFAHQGKTRQRLADEFQFFPLFHAISEDPDIENLFNGFSVDTKDWPKQKLLQQALEVWVLFGETKPPEEDRLEILIQITQWFGYYSEVIATYFELEDLRGWSYDDLLRICLYSKQACEFLGDGRIPLTSDLLESLPEHFIEAWRIHFLRSLGRELGERPGNIPNAYLLLKDKHKKRARPVLSHTGLQDDYLSRVERASLYHAWGQNEARFEAISLDNPFGEEESFQSIVGDDDPSPEEAYFERPKEPNPEECLEYISYTEDQARQQNPTSTR